MSPATLSIRTGKKGPRFAQWANERQGGNFVNTGKLKKILVGMLVVGALAAAMSGSTFATFSAQTTNPSNFKTGTLLLGNTVGAGTECFSTAVAGGVGTITTNTNTCSNLFSLTNVKPGDSGNVAVTVKNEGSINGSALTVYAQAACAEAGANYIVGGNTFNGSATDLCAQAQLSVDQDGTCFYGPAGCANDATHTFSGFASTYTPGSSYAAGALNAGSQHVYTFHWALPSSLDNSYQARQASFNVVFNLVQ